MEQTSTPLLATKLYIPPQRPNLVARPRLAARLEAALHTRQRLTLVSAKAGAGKTTLVSAWLHQQAQPTAWVSLDENDNDPRRFIHYLVAALHKLEIEIGQGVLGQFDMPQLPEAKVVVAELINDMAASAIPFLLVLDDYHLIHEVWIHQAVEFLAQRQPPEMHLILITRVDPPLPLARLRGRGQMTEIRDHDLRFTAGEAAQFLNEVMALDLPAEAISALEWRTEGWIVGLQMASLAMQTRTSMPDRRQDGDVSGFIEAFGGTSRFILDYLMEEVLNQQPAAIREFLIESSFLARMCGDLCDAVRFGFAKASNGSQGTVVRFDAQPPSGSDGTSVRRVKAVPRESQAILAQLEQSNLFVTPLDDERRWYRYHHLFADLLSSILRQRRSADEIRELHRLASRWHQDEGSLEEAMIHAIAAQDYERAASMIDENIVSMLSRSEAPVLLSWIEKLPNEITLGRP
jgi:LuxR family maltose regulon positive regulatory protein